MGFFSKMFYKPPPKEIWSEIALNISKSIESVGAIWFDKIIDKLIENSHEIKNTTVAGDGELALKAYQLYLSVNFIASNQYISSENGKDFADILFAYVCGNKTNEILEFFGRYVDTEDGDTISRFSIDISSYILGTKSVMGLLLVSPSIIELGLMLDAHIAKHFGDESTSNKMNQKLQNFSL